jgi:hypothetical protein
METEAEIETEAMGGGGVRWRGTVMTAKAAKSWSKSRMIDRERGG